MVIISNKVLPINGNHAGELLHVKERGESTEEQTKFPVLSREDQLLELLISKKICDAQGVVCVHDSLSSITLSKKENGELYNLIYDDLKVKWNFLDKEGTASTKKTSLSELFQEVMEQCSVKEYQIVGSYALVGLARIVSRVVADHFQVDQKELNTNSSANRVCKGPDMDIRLHTPKWTSSVMSNLLLKALGTRGGIENLFTGWLNGRKKDTDFAFLGFHTNVSAIGDVDIWICEPEFNNKSLSSRSCVQITVGKGADYFEISTDRYDPIQVCLDILIGNFTIDETDPPTKYHLAELARGMVRSGIRVLKPGVTQKCVDSFIKEVPKIEDIVDFCADQINKHHPSDAEAAFLFALTICEVCQLSDDATKSLIQSLDQKKLFNFIKSKQKIIPWIKSALIDKRIPFSLVSSYLEGGAFLLYPRSCVKHGDGYAFRLPFFVKGRIIYFLLPYKPSTTFSKIAEGDTKVFLELISLLRRDALPDSVYPFSVGGFDTHSMNALADAWMESKDQTLVGLGMQLKLSCSPLTKDTIVLYLSLLPSLLELSEEKKLERARGSALCNLFERLELAIDQKLPKDPCGDFVKTLSSCLSNGKVPSITDWNLWLIKTGDPVYSSLAWRLFLSNEAKLNKKEAMAIVDAFIQWGDPTYSMLMLKRTIKSDLPLMRKREQFCSLQRSWSMKPETIEVRSALLYLQPLALKILQEKQVEEMPLVQGLVNNGKNPKSRQTKQEIPKQQHSINTFYLSLSWLISGLYRQGEVTLARGLLNELKDVLSLQVQEKKKLWQTLLERLDPKNDPPSPLATALLDVISLGALEPSTKEILDFKTGLIPKLRTEGSITSLALVKQFAYDLMDQGANVSSFRDLLDEWRGDELKKLKPGSFALHSLRDARTTYPEEVAKEVSNLLKRVDGGDCTFDSEAMKLFYDVLGAIAGTKLSKEAAGELHTNLLHHLSLGPGRCPSGPISTLIEFLLDNRFEGTDVLKLQKLLSTISPSTYTRVSVLQKTTQFLMKDNIKGGLTHLEEILKRGIAETSHFKEDFILYIKMLVTDPERITTALKFLNLYFKPKVMNFKTEMTGPFEVSLSSANPLKLTFRERSALWGSYLHGFLKAIKEPEKESETIFKTFETVACDLFADPEQLGICLDLVLKVMFPSFKKIKFDQEAYTTFAHILCPKLMLGQILNPKEKKKKEENSDIVKSYSEITTHEGSIFPGYYSLIVKKIRQRLVDEKIDNDNTSSILNDILCLIFNLEHASCDEVVSLLEEFTFLIPYHSTVDSRRHLERGASLLQILQERYKFSSLQYKAVELYYKMDKGFVLHKNSLHPSLGDFQVAERLYDLLMKQKILTPLALKRWIQLFGFIDTNSLKKKSSQVLSGGKQLVGGCRAFPSYTTEEGLSLLGYLGKETLVCYGTESQSWINPRKELFLLQLDAAISMAAEGNRDEDIWLRYLEGGVELLKLNFSYGAFEKNFEDYYTWLEKIKPLIVEATADYKRHGLMRKFLTSIYLSYRTSNDEERGTLLNLIDGWWGETFEEIYNMDASLPCRISYILLVLEAVRLGLVHVDSISSSNVFNLIAGLNEGVQLELILKKLLCFRANTLIQDMEAIHELQWLSIQEGLEIFCDLIIHGDQKHSLILYTMIDLLSTMPLGTGLKSEKAQLQTFDSFIHQLTGSAKKEEDSFLRGEKIKKATECVESLIAAAAWHSGFLDRYHIQRQPLLFKTLHIFRGFGASI